jgi:hypothetical protein
VPWRQVGGRNGRFAARMPCANDYDIVFWKHLPVFGFLFYAPYNGNRAIMLFTSARTFA